MSNLRNKTDHFDVRAWLEDREISYVQGPAPNVASGWIGIQCPFPFCGDTSYHLGIAPWKLYTCWRCGSKGDMISLIQVLDDCGFKKAVNTLELFQDYSIKELKQEVRKKYHDVDFLPGSTDGKIYDSLYGGYLHRRGFNISVIDKYGLYATGNLGEYKFRIIIPVYLDRRVVNFTARDVTGQAKVKYKHCPNDRAIIPMKQLFYNVDNIRRDRIIIVEGPLDVWKIGDGAIASMGIETSTSQVFFLKNLVRDKGLKKIFVMFDAEELAQKKAIDLGFKISSFCECEIITLPKADPGAMSDQEGADLRRDIFND